jgi:predicted nuclease of restriction endonuclease-like (RecB) superfamily
MVATMAKPGTVQAIQRSLFCGIKTLIDQSRQNIALAVNAEITALYWHIGRRIKDDVLSGERAEYGERTIEYLSERLTEEYGRGWSAKQLRHCVRLAEVFPDEQIVSTLWRQLSWSHLKEIIYVEEPIQREFYIEICKMEKWSVRILRERIQSMLFERTAISKKPDKTIERELQTLKDEKRPAPDLVFRDPYVLDFLGLGDSYSEKDFESAIIMELSRFITELGTDFAFLARQKRITVDNEDYYIDLLFFHRRLKCLVAIDLKLGKFKAAYKGQMELYLRWLEKHETREGENLPVGLILCSGKNEEHVELLRLDKSNIRVAEYLTKLPDMKLLTEKLKLSVDIARQKLERNAAEGT